jgi:hypothetical protein
VRRIIAAAVAVGIVAAGLLLTAGPASAGADSGDDSESSEIVCTFTVSPTTLAGPGEVTVSGVAPPGTEVTIFVNGQEVAETTADEDTGEWSVVIAVSSTSDITVGTENTYPTEPCEPGVVRVTVGAAARRLAVTGSSGISAGALVGIAAIVIGTVLLVATRRRAGVRARL